MSMSAFAGASSVPAAPLVPTTPNAPKKAKGAAGDPTSALGSSPSAEDQSNRFLKLLVAQMSNQDPLNPMDSAQVTSQMAQISTVQGVQTLNKTVSGLDAQFTQLQTMQGAALVGRDVATKGNHARVDADTGKADGGFELSTAATSVDVDVVNPAGQSVGTLHLGAQTSGRHSFSLDVPEAMRGQPLTFKVSAMNNDTPLDAQPLAYRSIDSVGTSNGRLSLELDDGQHVDYGDVYAFL